MRGQKILSEHVTAAFHMDQERGKGSCGLTKVTHRGRTGRNSGERGGAEGQKHVPGLEK